MNRKIYIIFAIVVILGGGFWLWQKYKGALPVVLPPSGNIAETLPIATTTPNSSTAENLTGLPLSLPKGFSISIVAKNLPGARVLAKDQAGNLWVSQTGEGKIGFIRFEQGKAQPPVEPFSGLKRPHGLAFDPANPNILYVAEETKISSVNVAGVIEGGDSKPPAWTKIIDLPKGGRHFTRTLGFGPDGRLYVSVGSTCDVCREGDERYAAIYSLNKDGSDFKPVAKGLRNSVFFRWSEFDGKMYATEMGRDNLGDNLPPDEINVIDTGTSQALDNIPPGGISGGQRSASASAAGNQGSPSPLSEHRGSGQSPADFGWPICYGNKIHDTNFDKNQYFRDPCTDTIPPLVELPAHSAPLGLAFAPDSWPNEYKNNILVALHGSWNRSVPTGYKIIRLIPQKDGGYKTEDFISGWLASDAKTALGRPVDILAGENGIIYVSDDKAGVVYEVSSGATPLNSSSSDIKDLNLKENQVIASPLKITGQAKGSWFFEASFPVKIVDANWKEIGSDIAQAHGDWMTPNFVPFEVNLKFSKPATQTGWIIFKKDNPSGLPQNDAEFHFPVKF